jgi:hypothetical protein
MWHLQPTRFTARFFEHGSYEERSEPYVIAQVDVRSDGTAFIHAAMRSDGQRISPSQWRDLARQLRENYNVKVIQAERDHEVVTWQTSRV